MIAKGEVLRRGPRGVLVRHNGKLYEMGYGAYLLWKAFEEDSTPEEVIAQAIAITGMRREEAESIVYSFVETFRQIGLIGDPEP
ncbi:hypothetical protein IPA_01555 [Ignicoccus pacificus DSM 13166]|uniref:PqqD family protein n=1 Tax=Ignicoccus pacificus DSM 13166 TaxID=940294 RepID=A0A977KAH7_9CREN|nr:hypothetical protein IPA_01555 [Ignicoccus pacificus DSM 13166]